MAPGQRGSGEELAGDSATVAAVDPAALDQLQQMTGDDPAFLRELVETYLDDAPGQLRAMRSAVNEDDPTSLRRAAHTLKSNSSNMGAGLLAEQCRQVEALAALGRADGTQGLVSAAETEFERVRHELEALVPAVPET